jgi:hypothetical protein
MSKRSNKEAHNNEETDGKKQKTVETVVDDELASKEPVISKKKEQNAAPETKMSDDTPSTPLMRRVRNPALMNLVPSPLSDRVLLNSSGTAAVKVTMNIEIFCIEKSPVFVCLLPQSSGLADDRSLSDFIRGKKPFRSSLFEDATTWLIQLIKAESEWNTPGAYVVSLEGMKEFIKVLVKLGKNCTKYRSIFMIFAGEATIRMQHAETEEVVVNQGINESARFIEFLDFFLETLNRFRFGPGENYSYKLVTSNLDIHQEDFKIIRPEIHRCVKEQQRAYALRQNNQSSNIDTIYP